MPRLATLLVAALAGSAAACNLQLGQEYPDPSSEADAFAKMQTVVQNALNAEHASGAQTTRFFHAKGNGCVRGTLTVDSDISSDLAQGVFAQPGHQWSVVVRLSNGQTTVNPDSTPDTRGFAVKVLNVPGPRLMPGDHSGVQDFISAMFPTFLTHSIEDVGDLMSVMSQTGISGAAAKAAFFASHPATALALARTAAAGALCDNPLGSQYWSQLPYRWGPDQTLAVKFMFQPCVGVAAPTVGSSDPNFLREAANEMLNADGMDACFDMYVQRQEDACDQPIEDGLAEWDTDWEHVGTINIPANQDLDSPISRQHCEDAEFNPWHGITAHQPLGIGRVRKLIYPVSSAARPTNNGRGVYQYTA